jgi:hypothetical protein
MTGRTKKAIYALARDRSEARKRKQRLLQKEKFTTVCMHEMMNLYSDHIPFR